MSDAIDATILYFLKWGPTVTHIAQGVRNVVFASAVCIAMPNYAVIAAIVVPA